MRYELQAIATYASKIAKLTNTSFETEKNWRAQQGDVLRFANGFKENNSKAGLGNFAAALYNAATYQAECNRSSGSVSRERQDFIEHYFKALKDAYSCLYPKGGIKAPMSIVQPTALQNHANQGFLGRATALRVRAQQNSQRENGLSHAPALNSFLASNEFRALQDYLDNTLNDDNRSHSYLCGLISFHEDRKAAVLQQLITDIKNSASTKEVIKLLGQFYSEKNKVIMIGKSGKWQDSRFDILNTGQNITTRFFSAFGMQTTTINLIDSLAISIGVNPEQAAEAKPRSSNKANLG